MAFFTKHYHSPGTSPGTLREHDDHVEEAIRLRVVRYSKTDVVIDERDDFAPEALPAAKPDQRTWLHVQGRPSGALLARIGAHFNLHPLALEDVHNAGQRPKMDEYDEQLFVVLSLPQFDERSVTIYQTSFFIAPDYLLSFSQGPTDPFLPVLKRLKDGPGKMRGLGTDYLLYALLDTVIDQGFPVLESFGLELELIEEKIVANATHETLTQIHDIKRELILLRRMLWPQREVIGALLREDGELISETTRVYYRDCYDHTVQIMELLESYRDMSVSMLDIYLSSMSNRMNETMRVLTVIATIFIPLTFIVGVYGMNFGDNPGSPWAMPELHWYYGYPLIWLFMILIAVGMLGLFRRRGWL